jgi:formylglycine-generating enzyme required for sulfatase activity
MPVSHDLLQYRHHAARFAVRPCGGGGRSRPLRVAHSLVTCGMAVSVLNQISLPPEPRSAYRYVNVHNPRCPLFFSVEETAWACASALEDHPVWGINWAGANLICEHLGGRLPSAREWESFASNNDPTRTYPWGDAAPTHLLANFGEHFGGTSSVCSFPASELGLYDLAGNVSEWCRDHFETAGGRPISCERVVKGGAWSKDARYLEIATSRGKWERLGTTTIGFRPVWDD